MPRTDAFQNGQEAMVPKRHDERRRGRGKLRKSAASFAMILICLSVLWTGGCAPEDMPSSSPQGSESGPSNTENRINPSQQPDSSFIYDATISSLEKADAYMDGQTVQVVGEAVGDRVLAEMDPSHCWITLEAIDGTYSEVACYMASRSAEAIDTYGAYGRHGTTLQVRGTFNLACADHEGLSDLHATNVEVVSQGYENKTPFNMSQVIPGIVLVALGGLLLFAYHRLREHQL